MANWYDENAHLYYPFITNQNVSSLPEIADCRFFITNPETKDLKVFLYEFTDENDHCIYTFHAKDGETLKVLTFEADKSEDWQCIWNIDNPDFYGFIVINGTGAT